MKRIPLTLEIKELGFSSSTWNFSEASHGKGAADGVGAAIKRKLDSIVSHGGDIPDALTAFNVLNEADMAVMLYYISQADIENFIAPANLKPVPGTMQLHQIINTDMENVIQYRSLSCFCSMSINSGYCKCLDLKSHCLISSSENEKQTEETKTDDETKNNEKGKSANRDLKRKARQKLKVKTYKKRKRECSSSESSTEDEEEPVVMYVDTDDDSDVTFCSENSSLESPNTEQFILDENTGLLVSKIDAKNLQEFTKSYETKNETKKEKLSNISKLSKVDILDEMIIAVDKYVVVKFDTNKTSKYYVGKILEMNGIDVKINFMRKKSNGTFYWPQIQDVSDMFSFDIIKVMNPPIRCRRGILEFEDDLSEYKIY